MRSFKNLDPKRKAMILYVILVLLTLFLVVGICFVLMAEAEATASRIYREAAIYRDEYPTPQELLGWSLGSLIYDAADGADTFSGDGRYNAIRGNSLARNMYGWNYTGNGPLTGIGNNVAFNGSGRLHLTGANAQNPWRNAPFNLDDFDLPNATYFSKDPNGVNGNPFLSMPERVWSNGQYQFTGGANAPYTYPDRNNWYLGAVDSSGDILARSFWRANTPFGTLDSGNQNWYLPFNENTKANAHLKHLTFRPRPGDQLLASEQNLTAAQVQNLVRRGIIFPGVAPNAAVDQYGDVRNLPIMATALDPAGTRNDSIWVDLGYPAVQLKFSNRWVKPLFAILVVDLDNRINLTVAGNTKEDQTLSYHGSTQGWGRWEINPNKLITVPNANEYLNLFRGDTSGTYPGRFGIAPGTLPDQPGPAFPTPDRQSQIVSLPGNAPKNYARVDYDGSRYNLPPGAPPPGPPYQPPYAQAALPAGNLRMVMPNGVLSAFPNYDAAAAGGVTRYGDGSNFERQYHPSLFNPFNLNLGAGWGYTDPRIDQNLPIGDLRYLMRYDVNYGLGNNNVPNELKNSRIGQLWPNILYGDANLFRRITPYSMDMDVAGAAPGTFDAAGSPGIYQMDMNPAIPPGQRFPQSQGQPITFGQLVPSRGALPPGVSDLRNNDWRSVLPDLGRVDLNRPLTSYPAPPQPGFRFAAADTAQVNQAQKDRVLLARDIFMRFVAATGATPPSQLDQGGAGNIGPNDPRFEATRYLAQLAVNIVDYIDEDDYITAFNWLSTDAQLTSLTQPFPALPVDPNGWVFGTELPRVVINEAYAQVMNHPADTFSPPGAAAGYQAGGTGDPDTDNDTRPFQNIPGYPAAPNYVGKHATMDYRVNFFVELHNPHSTDPNLSESSAARLQLSDPGVAATEQGVYQIQILSQVDKNALRAVGNVTGAATTTNPQPNIKITCGKFDPDPAAPPAPPNGVVAPDKYTYTVQPANKQYGPIAVPPGTSGSNMGYYVIGPSNTTAQWQADFPYERGGMPTPPPPFRPTLGVQNVNIPAFPAAAPPSAQFPGYPNQMNTTLNVGTALNGQPGLNGIASNPDYQCTVLLRRLANPNVQGNNDPAQSFYNPFVTVDYIDGVQIYDATLYDNTRPRDGQGAPPRPVRHKMSVNNPMTGDPPRRSWGRPQPFRAAQVVSPSQNPNAPTSMPWSTFTRQNGDSPLPATGGQNIDEVFDWPTHLDRQVSSPMELLNVSGFKPHEFTQQFILGPGRNTLAPPASAKNKHKHLVPWFDYYVDDSTGTVTAMQSRLSRCLEMLGTGDRTAGVAFGGRVMGKVNINTLWSTNLSGGTVGVDNQVMLRALADALGTAALPDSRSGNFFNQDDVDAFFRNMILRRTMAANGMPGNTDRPFWSLAIPNPVDPATGVGTDSQYPFDTTPGPNAPPNARGLNRTILTDRSGGATPPTRMIDFTDPTGNNHPYIQHEMLQKLAGHLTTRSNTFAVYVTTGFFHVRGDPNSNPAKLGAEVDPAMRHKMFAIVDRTNLTQDLNNARLQGPRPIFFPYTPITAPNDLTPLNQTDPGLVTLTVPGYKIGPNGGIIVRDTIDHNGDVNGNLYTDTSGEQWEIRAGTKLFLGTGTNRPADPNYANTDAEVVIVTAIDAPNSRIQVMATKRHYRNSAVCTQQIGNPGPQPLPIDYESPPYSNTVVPFRLILQ